MFKKLLPLLFLFAGFQANATLIDNGDFTTDVESGLDWLDWTLTSDKTEAQALTKYIGAGWRVATGAEADELIVNQFGLSFSSLGITGCYGSSSCAADRVRFVDLLGSTDYRAGSLATVEGYGLVGAVPNYLYKGYEFRTYGDTGYFSRDTGVALVRVAAVSEPAIIALFGLGLVGIGFARRKRQS
jgi:hypothetical protein